jgi:hypothetical protein
VTEVPPSYSTFYILSLWIFVIRPLQPIY